MEPRLQRVCRLLLPAVRENAGRHEYDGQVPDLSPEGVTAGLRALGGPSLDDGHEDAHLAAFEAKVRVEFGELALHRRSPRALHAALDLSGYDRGYAPLEQRLEARRRHLAAWPDAIDAGLASLDRVPAAVAGALLPAVRGLAVGVPADAASSAALAAHRRLVDHLEHAAAADGPDTALGAAALTRLLSSGEALDVDLGRLAERADAERDRLRGMLADAARMLRPGVAPEAIVADLVTDHPDADGVLDEARALTAEVIAFTRDRGLVEPLDGECLVAPSPASRRWATAMLSWAAPYEHDHPSALLITPPDPSWSREARQHWLAAFSRTTLPATTVHEVAPGHFAHGRALRRARGDVARTLQSSAFVEGWAHYAEELCVEEGFRAGDPRFVVGVAMKALLRVTRLAVSIGVHSGAMRLDEAVARFERDAFLRGPVARAEAGRALFDPTYGRYTWGKLELRALRAEARRRWGAGFSLARFHRAVLALGAPPLGLLRAALTAPDGASRAAVVRPSACRIGADRRGNSSR